jgi:hypothetical protein
VECKLSAANGFCGCVHSAGILAIDQVKYFTLPAHSWAIAHQRLATQRVDCTARALYTHVRTQLLQLANSDSSGAVYGFVLTVRMLSASATD